ncbi:MAG: hypothetical protein V4722_07840 [Bacteroidota bacterium]
MKLLPGVFIATIYGLTLRLMYGLLNNVMAIMSVSFLVFSPLVIGFLTVLLVPKKYITSGVGAFFTPWLTAMTLLIVTIMLDVEGAICWVMIYPLFSVLAGIGGLIAYHIKKDKSGAGDWEKPDTFKVSLLVFVPLFIGVAEGDRTLSRQDFKISQTIVIPSSANEVWNQLTHINEIAHKENTASFSALMGFPKHLRTTLDTVCVGAKRMAIYEKGLFFEETITQFEPSKLLILDIKTDPANIPPTVMDEHILIGGKHVDILQDRYKIEKITDHSCRLTLSTHFYINTPFNWYAGIWARLLMNDILRGELTLIASRSALIQ